MFLTDGVDAAIIIATGGGIGAIITGFFTVRASRDARALNNKLGNGWAEELGETLGRIQNSADVAVSSAAKAAREVSDAKRKAASTDEQIRKTRGTVDRLSGQFDQHITQHQWKDR